VAPISPILNAAHWASRASGKLSVSGRQIFLACCGDQRDEWVTAKYAARRNGMNPITDEKQGTSTASAVPETGRAKHETAKPKAARKNATPSKKTKPAKQPKPPNKPAAAKKPAKAAERGNKKAEVIAMLKRPKGVTLAEISEATGWLKHTVRGFVSILGSKGGHTIESTKSAGGERTYRITS
jgi:hypothetical protein